MGRKRLEHTYVHKDMPPTIEYSTFQLINKSTCILHVPAKSKQYYSVADWWKIFS